MKVIVGLSSPGKAAMGPIGKAVVDITIVVSQIGELCLLDKVMAVLMIHSLSLSLMHTCTGFCCAYLIFISENLHSIYPRLSS